MADSPEQMQGAQIDPNESAAPDTSSLPVAQNVPPPSPAMQNPASAAPAQPQQPQKPSLWKSVVAGALSGLANSGGATHFGSGLAQGAAGVMKQKQQDFQNNQEEQRQNNANQAAQSEDQLRKVQTATAYANLATINRNFALLPADKQEKYEQDQAAQSRELAAAGITSPVTDVMDHDKAVDAQHEMFKAHPENLYTVEPDGRGQYRVMQANNAPIAADVTLTLPNGQNQVLPKGRFTGAEVQKFRAQIESQKISDMSVPNQAKATTANAAEGKAVAANKQGDAAIIRATTAAQGAAPSGPDSLGFVPKVQGKAADKANGAFKKNLDDLSKMEQSYQQFQNILANSKGDTLTGAQAIVGVFDGIGISADPLAGKGFRINNLTVDHHVQSTGLGEKIQRMFDQLKTGEAITRNQLKDYANIAEQVRELKYVTLVNQMHNQGLNADAALPTGNGQKIDPSSQRVFLRLNGWTGGKPTAQQIQGAQAAAKKKGWTD